MKHKSKFNNRVNEIGIRIADLEKIRIDSLKRPRVEDRLDSSLSVDSFWRRYIDSSWYKKKIHEIKEKTQQASVEKAILQYEYELKEKVKTLHEALNVALANEWIPYPPSPKQYRFLMLPDKEAFYGGAAGGGKSSALLMAAIMFCHMPDYKAILFRKTLEELNLPSGLIPRSKEWLRGKARWDGQSHRWTFPSGATLSFGYLNNVDDHFRYQSTEFQYIGFDELTHIPENQFRYLFSRLRRLKSQKCIPLRMRGTGNPEGRYVQYVKARYVDAETAIAPFVPALIEDNPGLDKESYIDSLSKLNPITRERLQNGIWDIPNEGLKFQRGWFNIVDDYPRDFPVVRYWDKAASALGRGKDPDWTVGVKATIAKGVLYVIDVVRFRGAPLVNESTIRRTAEVDGKSVRIYMEQEPGSAGVNDIDNYARKVLLGFSFWPEKTTDSKIVRADPLSAYAERGNVKIVKGRWNNDFLDEFEIFPQGRHDDIVDSTAGAFSILSKHTPLGGGGVPSIFR